jgi:lipopolysaccharide export LptBFGC system permease protein LptF
MAAFGRLAGDNEITAIQANGVGFHQLLAPTGRSHCAHLITFWFNDNAPESNHRLSQLAMEIQRAADGRVAGNGSWILPVWRVPHPS